MASVHGLAPNNLAANKKPRPFTAGGTVNVTDYPLPKNTLPAKSPSFAFSQDKSQNFLEVAQRKGKKLPGPGDYEVKSCFEPPK